MRFGENNLLGTIYIYILILLLLCGSCGSYMVNLTFFVYYSWKQKSTRAARTWPILKLNSTSFLLKKKCILGWRPYGAPQPIF